MLRRLDLRMVGEGQHRSGWPYCMQSLDPLFTDDAEVLFDDFIERTFFYERKYHVNVWHKQPWVGVFHHPPDMPTWYMDNLRLQKLRADPKWVRSEPQLRLIVTMGENLQRWCQETWPAIPCVTIRHPTGQPQMMWSPANFLRSDKRKIVQVGWFLRNMLAIQQARLPAGFKKIQLVPRNEWVRHMTWLCRKMYAQLHPEREDVGEVEQWPQLEDTHYDILLAESVVLMEVISAVANNTVIECMARNTPICINRHPGPVGYLGEKYPLFYDHFDEIERVLTIENIMAAHQYLSRMDKWWLRGAMFREQLQAACLQHVPECRATVTSPPQDMFCAV